MTTAYTISKYQLNNKDLFNPNHHEIDDKSFKNECIFKQYNTIQKRLNLLKYQYSNKIDFIGNSLYLLGFGGQGRTFLYLFMKRVLCNPKNIIIIDSRNISLEAEYFSKLGVNVISNYHIDKYNYRELLKYIQPNDIIVDAAIEIDTKDMYMFCQEKGCSYINSCIENWDFKTQTNVEEYSILYKHRILEEKNRSFYNRHNTNFIISMGCNPGNVSIWLKYAILEIAKRKLINTDFSENIVDWALLSKILGIKTIHISEKDTQIVNQPKNQNEYCNTWSSTGEAYYEEVMGGVEGSWGTHEPNIINKDDMIPISYNEGYIIWKKRAAYVSAQTWVPHYGKMIGNIIRHDEAYTMGRTLSIYNKNGELLYKPSIYYVYNPTIETNASVQELKERNNHMQESYRYLTDEIIDGRDILGLTFYLDNGEVYWIGSMLSIHEARRFYEPEFHKFVNATNTTVSAGMLSGVIHIIEQNKIGIKSGLICPDDLPYQNILSNSIGYLGDFIFTQPVYDFKLYVSDNRFGNPIQYSKNWIFSNFLIDDNIQNTIKNNKHIRKKSKKNKYKISN